MQEFDKKRERWHRKVSMTYPNNNFSNVKFALAR